jgi:UDP-glucose:tetrahydrobiopterin glucosyltransferase
MEEDARVRIAFIAPLVTIIAEPQRGGSQAILADLAVGLSHRGHVVTVFAADGSAIPGIKVIEVGVDPADLAHTLFRDGHRNQPSPGAERAFRNVARLVAAERFDIVHNHAFDVPAVRALSASNVPVVHTMHLPPTTAMVDALRRRMLGRGGPITVITVSGAQSRAWSGVGIANVVIPNGVPVGRIPWSSRPGCGALFAGRFSPEKGAMDAIQIAERAGLTIAIAGWAYDRGHAERELAPLMSGPGVISLGLLARQDLWRSMVAAAVVLCPARWDEPFGLVAAEAQAAGTPVVAYRRGALPEVIAEGVTGILVPEGDIDAATEAVGRVLCFDRAACRRHAESTLDIGTTVKRLEVLYGSLVGSTGL